MSGLTRLRQLAFVMRLEFQRYLCGRRYIGIYLLAVAPLFILGATDGLPGNDPYFSPFFRGAPIAFAQIFGSYELRLLIFFSCALMFSQLFRGEVLEKTLHYYFTAPIRRDIVVLGKYF